MLLLFYAAPAGASPASIPASNRENGKGGMRKGGIGQVNRNTQQTNKNKLDFPIPPFLIPPFPISQNQVKASAVRAAMPMQAGGCGEMPSSGHASSLSLSINIYVYAYIYTHVVVRTANFQTKNL